MIIKKIEIMKETLVKIIKHVEARRSLLSEDTNLFNSPGIGVDLAVMVGSGIKVG